MIGKQILNYTIDVFVAEGGMGSVYTGTHTQIGRKVAIKVLHQHLSKIESIKKRFQNEARTLSVLQHPNIVQLYDYSETADNLYLIMEFVDGISLEKYLKNSTSPISEEKAIGFFTQILDAMEFAHKNRVVHRDIKPSNFMIRKDGVVKILDFGIAKLLDDKEYNLTQSGAKIGTVMYMSPEQIKGLEANHLSDIYSLGVTLFQILTSKVPYETAKSEFEIQLEIVRNPLPRANLFNNSVSQRLMDIIDKATAKLPADRFQSCAEFSQALANPNFSYTIHANTEKVVEVSTSENSFTDIHEAKTQIIEQHEAKISENVPSSHTNHADNKQTMYKMVGISAFILILTFLVYFFFFLSNQPTNQHINNQKTETETIDKEKNRHRENKFGEENQRRIKIVDTSSKPEIEPIDKPENDWESIPEPASFSEYFSTIANSKFDFDARIELMNRFISNEFESNRVVVELMKNGVTTDYFTIEDYLRRIAINETRNVSVINRHRNSAGKTTLLQITE